VAAGVVGRDAARAGVVATTAPTVPYSSGQPGSQNADAVDLLGDEVS
jgi:hypothetical protein